MIISSGALGRQAGRLGIPWGLAPATLLFTSSLELDPTAFQTFAFFLGSNYLRYTPGGQKQLEEYLQFAEHRCSLPMFFFSLSWRRLLNLSWRRLGAPVLETLQEIILNRSQHTPLELYPTAC